MSFLTINGAVLPVAMGTLSDAFRDPGGEPVVAMSGLARKSRPVPVKRDLTFETTPLLQSDAKAWELLIRGEGDFCAFVTKYTHKGYPIGALTNGASISTVLGSRAMTLPASGAGPVATGTFPYYFTSARSTVLVVRSINGVADGQYVLRSDGLVWRQPTVAAAGVVVGFPTWASLGTSSVTLSGLTGAAPANTTSITQVFVFPELMPAAWALSGIFGNFQPRLHLQGDALTGLLSTTPAPGFANGMRNPGNRYVIGAVEGVSAVRANVGGVLYKNLRRLSVRLSEW